MGHEIKRLQNYGMRLITSSPRLACNAMLRSRLGWVPLEQRRRLFRLALVHKCLLGRAPQYLCSKFVTNESLGLRTTRGSSNLYLKRPTTNFYRNSFEYQGAFDWNHLPNNIKTICSETAFTSYVPVRALILKNFFFISFSLFCVCVCLSSAFLFLYPFIFCFVLGPPGRPAI